jgi:hypothetical protein
MKELFETDQRKDFNSKTMDMTTMGMMTTTTRTVVRLVPQSSTDSKGNRRIRNNNNEYQKEQSETNMCMARSNANDSTTGTLKDM